MDDAPLVDEAAWTTLLISVPADDDEDGPAADEEREIGCLVFDEAGVGKLELLETGSAAEALEQAWAEISQLEAVPWRGSRPREIDGTLVRVLVGRDVPRADPAYRLAVLDHLERAYGFEVEVEDADEVG